VDLTRLDSDRTSFQGRFSTKTRSKYSTDQSEDFFVLVKKNLRVGGGKFEKTCKEILATWRIGTMGHLRTSFLYIGSTSRTTP
jgi:hypothetical protein